jgi:hypothetical protein
MLSKRAIHFARAFKVPDSPWRPQFLAFLREHRDKELLRRDLRIRNNTHGLVAYPSPERPIFVEVDASQSVLFLIPLDWFETVFATSIAQNYRLTEQERVAFSLFNASFFQSSADGRFLLLMMAVEPPPSLAMKIPTPFSARSGCGKV